MSRCRCTCPTMCRSRRTSAAAEWSILTDPYFPGWRAYVDGKRAPIVEAYGGVRGVVVEAGDHLVEMRYRPWSVLLGALMTLAAALITIIVNRRSSSIHCDRIDLRTLR